MPEPLYPLCGQGRENITKHSWVEIRTRRDLRLLCGQNRLGLGKLMEFNANEIQSRIMTSKTNL